ncbi:MAG: translation elongation factor Ts [Polyangiaceae bacterium UTPRO1]|jgi:elongation factor Ts|nr:translation elongation factor Ts [Myxococcales bacterium]OQY68696.1 MAG: translation elongation factor Ts [Polyangiaceae bacterium UTPRO1]
MSDVSARHVKDLREKTGAGFMDCKTALRESGGDFEGAVRYLRERGLAAAAKKAGRATAEGIVGSYIHAGGKIGVLIEVNCETDFVARTDDFQAFVRNLAMQVAAARPLYVSREEIPAAELERERAIYAAQAAQSGKPEQVVAKMVDGKIDKYVAEVCLLDQDYVKEPGKAVRQVVTDAIAKLGENISVRRFVRFQLGEGIEEASGDNGAAKL